MCVCVCICIQTYIYTERGWIYAFIRLCVYIHVGMHAQLLSHVQFFAIPWTAAHIHILS